MSPDPQSQLDSPRAWLVVIGAFIGAFVSFGVTYTFGIFLRPMSQQFHVSHAKMSILFSVIAALTFFVAPLTGELADKHGPRPVIAVGAILMAASLLITARMQSYPQVLLTYGGGLGLAAACIYVPGVSAVGEWFKKRRDIALGIAISGIGCGTLVAAPLAAMLIDRYGWREAFDIFGWSAGVLLLISATLMSRPPEDARKVKAEVGHKVRTPAFAFLYVSLMFSGAAVFISFVFIPVFAMDIGVSRVAAATVIGYIGASSVVGRLGLNALAPRFGLLTMYQISFLILLLSFGLWMTATSYASLIVFGLVMGVGYGGMAAMAPAVAADIFGIDGLGELLGIFFTGFGVACIFGPPLAGYLADYTHDYKWPVFVAAAVALLGLLLVIPVKRYQPKPAEEERAAGAA